jgi:hypothetical protein
MTLLVAQRAGSNVWMVADSAITGGVVDERQREYALKIEPSLDGKALAGFSGDYHHGTRLVHRATSMPAGTKAIKTLLDGHREYPNIEFAYAYVDDLGCHLFRIADGRVEELQTFHLGSTDAFEDFQGTRLGRGVDHAPEAVKTFIAGSRAPEPISDDLATAITTMLQVFAERSERDVGGWATGYFLTKDGAFLCGYGYSVSDPILTKIGPGSVVPHGTADAGGFGLSVTEFGERQGVVVYWLQQPGGTVFVRSEHGYQTHRFAGGPTEFITRASAALDRKVEIFFGDQPSGPAQSVSVLHDVTGAPSMAVALHGGSISLSVLNVATPFKTRGTINLASGAQAGALRQELESDLVTISVGEDHRSAVLKLIAKGEPTTQVELNAHEMDILLELLIEARLQVEPAVPKEPQREGPVRQLVVLDPAWRTELPMHPSLNGITLRLRHPGAGWLTFLLPWHEVKNLGDWLSKSGTQSGTS